MRTSPEKEITRRTLLQASGALLGAASLTALLSGCGGSGATVPTEGSFPEVYREAYRLHFDDGGDASVFRRIVAVTDTGDVLISEGTTRYNDSGESTPELRLVRYENRAQPGQTVRTESALPNVTGEVFAGSSGLLYASQYPLEETGQGGGSNELLVLDLSGHQVASVSLANTNYSQTVGTIYTPYYSLSVSPSGEFYRPATVPTPEGDVYGAAVLRWDRDGKFVRSYVGAGKRRFIGFWIVFAADGAPYTLGYDDEKETLGVVAVEAPQAGFVPVRTTDYAAERSQLQVDDSGNLYFVSSEPGSRATRSRTSPPPRTTYLRKFSAAGVELAYIRLTDSYIDPSFAVSGDGTVYVNDAYQRDLIVFHRSR